MTINNLATVLGEATIEIDGAPRVLKCNMSVILNSQILCSQKDLEIYNSFEGIDKLPDFLKDEFLESISGMHGFNMQICLLYCGLKAGGWNDLTFESLQNMSYDMKKVIAFQNALFSAFNTIEGDSSEEEKKEKKS